MGDADRRLRRTLVLGVVVATWVRLAIAAPLLLAQVAAAMSRNVADLGRDIAAKIKSLSGQ